MKVGSLAIVIPMPEAGPTYQKGDIISFTRDNDKKNIITHRIVSKVYSNDVIFDVSYLTAGDANKQPDQGKIRPEQIIGKMIFSIPYVGYLIDFVKKPYGFILFVIIPATIIVYEELKSIKRELLKFYYRMRRKEEKPDSEKTGVNKLTVAVPLLCAAFVFTSLSLSFFSDNELASANIFQAGAWATPTPTPTSGPPIADHLVINEVYYDVAPGKGSEGDTANPDEWVELYNPTSSAVDIKDWVIGDNTDSDNVSSAQKFIPAGGFALIAKSNSTWTNWDEDPDADLIPIGDKIGNGLANDGDRVVLRDNNGNIVDQMSWGTDTSVFTPSATDVAEGHSLERDPDGVDTDTAGDFVDRTTPTPGS